MSDTFEEAPRRRGKTSDEVATEVKSVPRAEMRPEMREDSPAERAKRRAAEIRGHIGDMDEGTDEFFVPSQIIPEGWTYEWKRKLTLGAEEPSHMVALTRMGWEPVPVARHPEMMPGGGNYVHIERKGMILMERPTELVEEALEIERRRAIGQVRAKEAQLAGTPEGTMTRDDPRVAPKIKKAYEAMPVPKD